MTRQEAIQILIKSWTLSTEGYSEARDMAIKALEQEPCETIHGSTYGGVSWGGIYTPQEPKTGRWFVDERPESDREIICSNCEQPIFRYHKLDFDYRPKFCPNCGAKMESEDK